MGAIEVIDKCEVPTCEHLRPMELNQRVRLADGELAYGVSGAAGTPVLLIMGYTVSGRAWVHQVGTLSERHAVAYYDHRGCGSTRAEPGFYSMALLAEDACRLLDQLGWDSAHVVGVSMGGMVAQQLALNHPRRIRSLALIATHAGGPGAVLPTAAGLRRFVEANIQGVTGRTEALKRLLFPDDFLRRCDAEWLAKVLRTDFGKPVPLSSRLSQLAAVLRHDTRRRLAEFSGFAPLIVKAGQDVLVRPAESDRLHQAISGSRLVVFPHAGHGLIRQCFAELNRTLLAHFEAADRKLDGSAR